MYRVLLVEDEESSVTESAIPFPGRSLAAVSPEKREMEKKECA